MVRLLLVTAAVLLAACSASPEPSCGAKPHPDSLNPLEARILRNSVNRSSRVCGFAGEKCHFLVLHGSSELFVTGQIASFRKEKCVRGWGRHWIDSYDAQGQFLGRSSGQ